MPMTAAERLAAFAATLDTSAMVPSTQVSGGASIPAGLIVMWGGLLVNIPVGWKLCDGTLGTPDLRGLFVKGALTAANPGVTGGGAHTHAAHVVTQAVAHAAHVVTQAAAHVVTQAAAHANHVVTQPAAHANHVVTQPAAHADNIAHTHGLNVQGGTTAATTGTHLMTSTAVGGSARAITAGDAGLSSGTGASLTHSGTAVDAHSAHVSGAVDAHSAHSGAAVDAHNSVTAEPAYYSLAFLMKT